MRGVHEFDEQAADRFRSDAGPVRPDLVSAPDTQTDGTGCSADTFSVRLLAAHEHDHEIAVLSVHGEIDLSTVPALREALLPVLEHHTGPVVVDLSEVVFMDSTGVHVLFESFERLKLQNRQLAIVCLEGGQVHQLLGLVGLLDIVAVHGSRQSALIGGQDILRSEPA